MAPRRETRRERFADTIRFVVLPSWKAVLALFFVLLFAWLMWFNSTRPVLTKSGEILHFGEHPARIHSGLVAVTIRDSNGAISELLPKPRDVAHCRVGDRITYTSGPTGLRIDGCSRPSP